MKTKNSLVICCSIIGAVFISCNHPLNIERPIDDATLRTLTINLDELDLSSQLSQMRNSVSFEDVQKFVSRTSPQTKGEEKDYEIIPQVDEENDTIFYLVQYEKGWKLIASDKRVQPILAENEEGRYEDMIKVDGPRIWTEILAYEMKTVKHLSDEEFKMPREEQEAWKKLWATYCDIDALLAALERPTKGGGIPPSLSGRYVYDHSVMSYVPYDSIPHMTDTLMYQGPGYNSKCPLKGDGNHALAGCGPIAATAVLKYLHSKIGVPTQAPVDVIVNGHVGDTITITPTSFSSTIWNSMQTSAVMAPFIAHFGFLSRTVYGDNASSTTIDGLRDAFPEYEVQCQKSDYNQSIAVSNLIAENPVIIFAETSQSGGDDDQHTFVLDAYKRYANMITDVYVWVYDYADQGYMFPEPLEPIRYEISYVNPVVEYCMMNWGWNTGGLDSTWYTLTGNWFVPNSGNYNYHRKMLYNFSAL